MTENKNAPEETEGGELGTGHNILAAFEMVLNKDSVSGDDGNLAAVTLFYRQPGSADNCTQQFAAPCKYEQMQARDSILIFASCVVMFGEKLKGSPYGNEISWDEISSLAKSITSQNNYIQNEFILLVEKAKKIYPAEKKKKKTG